MGCAWGQHIKNELVGPKKGGNALRIQQYGFLPLEILIENLNMANPWNDEVEG